MQPGSRPVDSLGKTASGQPVDLSNMRDKVVVISFWATWCGYCMKELPILAGLQAQATERHLPLQVVSIDHKEDRDVFLRTARILKPRLPGLLMSWDRDGSIGKPFGTDRGIPVMVMLHRDGTVAHVHWGYSEDMLDSLLAEINTLMAEPSTLPDSPAIAASPKTADPAN
jgi:thiol-disulfide isomerase/thioredoxin